MPMNTRLSESELPEQGGLTRWIWLSVRLLAILLVGVGVVRTAWVAEDAFITFRTVDNFFNGFGLRWNVAERVQTYSHPLWMMLLCVGRFVSGEYYYSSLVLSAVCTAGAVYLAGFRLPSSVAGGACALVILGCSKSFVDYSTSGLEAPLTHLLLALFVWVCFCECDPRKRLVRMSLIAALCAVNRADSILMFAPSLLMACRNSDLKSCIRGLVVGFLPLIAWVGFATLYYGTPIPITGYAKAMTGLSQGELLGQGVVYYRDVLTRDPILLPAIALALLVSLRRGVGSGGGLSVGVVLYLVYLLKIGGGYMGGRFLTPPLFLSSILIARSISQVAPAWRSTLVVAGSIGLGLLCKTAPILSGPEFNLRGSTVPESGIVDERGQWYPRTGLFAKKRNIPSPDGLRDLLKIDFDPEHPHLFYDGLVGLDGLLSGPGIHIVDPLLCDPLLMRLPTWNLKDWRIGHFERRLPNGYLLSVAIGQNRITHAGLARGYEDIRLITRGKLLDPNRLRAIWSLAFGEGAKGIREYVNDGYRETSFQTVEASDVLKSSIPGSSVWSEDFHIIGVRGLLVKLPYSINSTSIDCSLGGRSEYSISFRKEGKVLGVVTQFAERKAPYFSGLRPVSISVPTEAVKAGFDSILFKPKSRMRAGIYCLGSLYSEDL